MRQKGNLFLGLTVLQKAAMIMLLNNCSFKMMECLQAGLSLLFQRIVAEDCHDYQQRSAAICSLI